tara:strand:- start:11093 stop:12403 length:1311 start_codon:yes stop_codon:yes gene_type:complete
METGNTPALDLCFSGYINRLNCCPDRKPRFVKMYRFQLDWWILVNLILVSSGIGIIPSLCAAQITENPAAVLNRDPPQYLTNRNFRRVLSQPFSASWSNVGIRSIIQRISSTQNISIILDRRIDPSLNLKVDLQNLTLEQGLQQLAALANAKTEVVGSTIYIGPEKAVSNLKTLLEIKSVELAELAVSGAEFKSRLQFLSRNRTIHYQDLDQPAEILKQIAAAFQITINNGNQIPHDLWAHGTLSSVNANEALSLILIQFDFTYRWEEQATQIQLIPIPDTVTIKKTYTPRGSSVVAVTRRLKETFPELTVASSGKTITVSASSELHEKIEQFLNPGANSRNTMPQKVDAIPVQRRKFTLRVKNVPLLAIMKKLEQSGIEFEYDDDQLADAGIDLNQQIEISVNDANAREFFDSLFRSFKLNYQIEGTRVTLIPKK